ncbi:hypothetical protein DPMN_124399 [Dreissena polymorpha]|uniref:Uncharacterized protein n=1 Tax=Dreissena polymorpha TaxID=45954 RepID=A0A9D4GVI3_DREPO|nr:hypothetical protein DPMN_124399 [Dreissena polymorpha]
MKLSSLLESPWPLLHVQSHSYSDVSDVTLMTTQSEIMKFGTNTERNCYAKNGKGLFTTKTIAVL